MSAFVMVYLVCDGVDAGLRTCVGGKDGSTGEFDANNRTEARKIGRRLGWTREPGGYDFCPACTEVRRMRNAPEAPVS